MDTLEQRAELLNFALKPASKNLLIAQVHLHFRETPMRWLILITLVFVSCKGPAGPQGPQGPPGTPPAQTPPTANDITLSDTRLGGVPWVWAGKISNRAAGDAFILVRLIISSDSAGTQLFWQSTERAVKVFGGTIQSFSYSENRPPNLPSNYWYRITWRFQ